MKQDDRKIGALYFMFLVLLMLISFFVGLATASVAWALVMFLVSFVMICTFAIFDEHFDNLNKNISTVADCLQKALDDNGNGNETNPKEE